MAMIAQVLGGIVLLLWLFFIPVGRNYIRSHGSVMYATVFQYHVLPLVVGIGLLISGNLWHLPIAVVAWVLSIRFSWFFLHIFPLAAGWAYGSIIFPGMYPNSRWWPWAGGFIGLVGMFAACSVIVALVTRPRGQTVPNIPQDQLEAIDGLDEILKCLYVMLVSRYLAMYPTEPKEIIRDMAGVVLNELVVEDLRGDQVAFRQTNAEFVDREKEEVMKEEDVRKGILAFLSAKGGLFQARRHPAASTWISEAKRLDRRIDIPNTVGEVLETIEHCLAWYRDCPEYNRALSAIDQHEPSAADRLKG